MSTGKFKILDCTVRDGGYINQWDFSVNMVREMYRASAASGVDVFEVGFLSDDISLPLWRRCPKEIVKNIRDVCEEGPLVSAMLEANTVGIELGAPEQTGVDILRIALNRDKITQSIEKMTEYRKQGYKVFVQLMGITGYTDLQLLQVVEQLTKCGFVDVISIGDSYGSLTPKRTTQIITLIASNTTLQVGLHAHNNMMMGMANIIAAIEAGATYVDASMYGMGRGGGNVPLELVLAYFSRSFPERYDARPAIEFVDQNMVKMKKDMDWGYSVSSLISGVYQCHPYYTSKLVETREFTVKQVLKAVDIISRKQVIGFSKDVLSDVINSGDLISEDQRDNNLRSFIQQYRHKVAYSSRHKGKAFLILGNGPTLVKYQDKIRDFIKKYDPVVMGANNLADMFIPHYHAFNNQRRYNQFINSVNIKSKLFLGPGIENYSHEGEAEKIICFNSAQTPLKIVDDVITSNCSSISVLLGSVALCMGASSIYYAGMDGYADGSTMFYNEDENNENDYLLEKHNANDKYLLQLSQIAENEYNCLIRSITPTTYKGLSNIRLP